MKSTSTAIKSYRVSGGGGLTLYVEEAGNPRGIPLLFIHGFNQCRLAWRKQIHSSLAQDFRLVALDNRGHGLSDKPANAYGDSALWADDIQAVITGLELDRPILVGWSYGGLIIFDYLRFHGEKNIRGVNLVNARSRIGTEAALAETGAEYLALRPGFFSDNVMESIKAQEQFIRLCTYREPSPEDLYFFLGFNSIVPPYVRQGLMSRCFDNDSLLASLQIPFLITHGQEDRILPPSHALHNAGLLSRATLSWYGETGHNPFWERDERFNNELSSFALSL